MRRRSKPFDALIIGGCISSLFTGIVNPSYIKLIVSNLDVKMISLGSLIAAGLPFLTGMLLENQRLFRRLYALLPGVMLVEVVLTVLSVAVFSLNAAAYYLTAMVVFGLFSSTVMHLLQELKQRRYRRNRATFERRCTMADALGYLMGSLLIFLDVLVIESVQAILVLGFVQTASVYLFYLVAYRPKRAARRPAGASLHPMSGRRHQRGRGESRWAAHRPGRSAARGTVAALLFGNRPGRPEHAGRAGPASQTGLYGLQEPVPAG
jgi:hypothetical protein